MAQYGGAPAMLARSVDRDQPLAVAGSAASAGQQLATPAVARRRGRAAVAAARKAYSVPVGVDIAAAAGHAGADPVAAASRRTAAPSRSSGRPTASMPPLGATPVIAVIAIDHLPRARNAQSCRRRQSQQSRWAHHRSRRAHRALRAAASRAAAGWSSTRPLPMSIRHAARSTLCRELPIVDAALVRKILWPCRTAARLCDRRARC